MVRSFSIQVCVGQSGRLSPSYAICVVTGGMQEGLQRPDLLIVEGGRSLIKGVKQKDKAQALLSMSIYAEGKSDRTNSSAIPQISSHPL